MSSNSILILSGKDKLGRHELVQKMVDIGSDLKPISEKTDVSTEKQTYTLSTKYYECDVSFHYGEPGLFPSLHEDATAANAGAGFIVLCSLADQASVEYVTGWDVPADAGDKLFLLVVRGAERDDDDDNVKMKEKLEEWCFEHNAEYVRWNDSEDVEEKSKEKEKEREREGIEGDEDDAEDRWAEKTGPDRVVEAMQCCSWDDMRYKTDARPSWRMGMGGGIGPGIAGIEEEDGFGSGSGEPFGKEDDMDTSASVDLVKDYLAEDMRKMIGNEGEDGGEFEALMSEVFALKMANDMDPELRKERAAEVAMKMMGLLDGDDVNDGEEDDEK